VNPYFIKAWAEIRNEFHCDWAMWLGGPMIYDSGLCVNRTPEEVAVSTGYYWARL
jgi:hypothetical protein